ncbi:MAG: hypothetical protein OEZ29_03650 [Candidatus Bathyarchaeota archaeon]|nr:hypothetical protein [Candidatus Bathyarchaeota archaeon]MDH5779669.1 hypothetical protein [Candidatus Bathyarchaeota archaeon]
MKVEFSPYISRKIKKINQVVKTMGVTEQEALKQMLEDDVELVAKATGRFATPKRIPRKKYACKRLKERNSMLKTIDTK